MAYHANLSNIRAPILIAGPTASGKSRLALEIAKSTASIIINADALQVYAQWHLLSARPAKEDLRHARHLLYGHVAPGNSYSVGKWLSQIRRILGAARNAQIIIVGGTGLYFQALTEGLSEIPPISRETKEAADALETRYGGGVFRDHLAKIDPEILESLDTANPKRTRRAWEVKTETGRSLKAWQAQPAPPPLIPLRRARAFLLEADVDWLNARITERFHTMIAQGAVEEVTRARAQFWDPKHPSCQAIGAKDIIAYLDGQITLESAIENAIVQTRRYAKRQRSWFRGRMKNWQQIPASDPDVAKMLIDGG